MRRARSYYDDRGVLTLSAGAVRRHTLRGLHSRIPICCIAYFLTVHMPRVLRGSGHWLRARHYLGRVRGAALALGFPSPEYVPCPVCLRRGHFIAVHKCTRRCAGQPGYCASMPKPLRLRPSAPHYAARRRKAA